MHVSLRDSLYHNKTHVGDTTFMVHQKVSHGASIILAANPRQICIKHFPIFPETQTWEKDNLEFQNKGRNRIKYH